MATALALVLYGVASATGCLCGGLTVNCRAEQLKTAHVITLVFGSVPVGLWCLIARNYINFPILAGGLAFYHLIFIPHFAPHDYYNSKHYERS